MEYVGTAISMDTNSQIYLKRMPYYSYIGIHLNMKRQTIRNLGLKYKQTGEIFESPRGKKTKL